MTLISLKLWKLQARIISNSTLRSYKVKKDKVKFYGHTIMEHNLLPTSNNDIQLPKYIKRLHILLSMIATCTASEAITVD